MNFVSTNFPKINEINSSCNAIAIIINDRAPYCIVDLPGTPGLKTTECMTIFIPTNEALLELLRSPVRIDEPVIIKAYKKLEVLVGNPVYPSTIAKLLFELAFNESETVRLTPIERTNNVGYLLNNLGSGKPELIEKLYAFYYGYSFAHFAEKRL